MNPVDVLNSTISSLAVCGHAGRKWRPGEIISRLPQEKREALKSLRSDDIANARIEGDIDDPGRSYRRARMRFDRSLAQGRARWVLSFRRTA